MASISMIGKPAQARWRSKAIVDPEGNARVCPIPAGEQHEFGPVEIAWYENTVKVTLTGAGPAKLTQTYLKGEGRDVIVEFELP